MKITEFRKLIREEIQKVLKEVEKVPEIEHKPPYINSNIFLNDSYLQQLDKLVNAVKDDQLKQSIIEYVEALETGWRAYDDTFDPEFDEFDGSDAQMTVMDQASLHYKDGTSVGIDELGKKLKPQVKTAIDKIFNEGKEDYYS